MTTAFIDEFNNYLEKEKEVSSNTLESYMRDVNRYITYLEQRGIDTPALADKETVEGFLQNLRDKKKSNATITRMLASVRAYYQFLMKSGVASGNPAKQIKLEKVTKKSPEVLTDKEIRQLLATPNVGEIKGARDKAMLEMLYATGIRVSELINLNIEDVRCVKGERGEVTCRSPRGARTVPMYRDATDSLYYYINSVRPLLVSEESGSARFINLNGNRLSRQGFWKIVKSYAEAANIEKEITPHTLRHSFALHLYQNGASLHELQIMLGHADISSTQLYATLSQRAEYSDVYDRCHPMSSSKRRQAPVITGAGVGSGSDIK